jgi:transcriptional regulator with XRE-family HTH domain
MGTTKRPYPRKLARKLKRIRLNAALSQTELAKSIGVKDRASISLYENGQREPPLPTLLSYARFARVIVDVLIDDAIDLPKS